MKDQSVAGEQLAQLRNKLSISNKARDELERTYESQFVALTDFLSRLANVAKGIDLELDVKLGKLRKLLDKKPDLEKIQPQLEEVNKLLNQHATRIQREMQSAQKILRDSGKKLQQIKGLPDQLRRDLRVLLKGIESPPDSMLHYLPVINQLTDLYQQALNDKAKLQVELGKDSEQEKAIDELTDHLHKEISEELLNLLGELAFSGNGASTIEKIRKQITRGINHNQLLECCLIVIKVIVQSILDERNSAETFLFSLNDALSNVHKAVSKSINQSKSGAAKKADLNETLKSSVTQMSSVVENATDMDSLKTDINQQLNKIVAALETKEELEAEEQLKLLQMLEKMQAKLQEMEQQANEYRNRLAEQRFKSLQDPLTKLPNRMALDERVKLEHDRWQRYNKPLCLAVLDIDHFKNINDSYGHAAGDKTLQVIAKAIKSSLRATDFVARYGGEEFVVVMPETDIKQAKAPLEILRNKVSKIPFKFKQDKLNITVSIGVSEFNGKDSKQQVFDRADTALYKAKNTGRNKLVAD